MKKRIVSLLLCLLLLSTVTGYAAVGGGDDPLISLSYLEDMFLPQLRQTLQKLTEQKVSEFSSAQPTPQSGMKLLNLAGGSSLRLDAGQQLVLVSGDLTLKVESGTLLNLTAGRTSIGGGAQRGNRYLVCGSSAVTATVPTAAAVIVSEGVSVTAGAEGGASGEIPFRDVPQSEWYYSDVVNAYKRGLVNGKTADSYEPDATLTVGEAVKLAACMHQLYHSGKVTLANAADGQVWYMSYVDYATNNGIMEQTFEEYHKAITRGEFIRLFFNALPEKEYTRVNLIMDGAIPDVATDAPLAKQVYTFYMAGILTGYAEGDGYLEHAFGPDSTIIRAEAATVMNRMFDPSARKLFTMD